MLVIFILLGLANGIRIAIKEGEFFCTFPILSAAAAFFVWLIVFSSVLLMSPSEISTEEKELSGIILNSESEYSSSFFLIAGSFSETQDKQYYFMSMENLGYQINSCDLDKAYINFIDDQNKVVVYSRKIVNTNWFHHLFGVTDGMDCVFPNYEYQFFIPESSYIEVYDVSLENLAE